MQSSLILYRKNTNFALYHTYLQCSSVQLLSRVQLFVTPWTAAHQASLSITNSWSPPKPMPIESVMPSNYLILCHPLRLPPSSFPAAGSFLMSQVVKVLEFQFQHQSFQSILRTDFLESQTGWTSLQDSQESSLALSFLYNPTLTSIHHYWKNHSFD